MFVALYVVLAKFYFDRDKFLLKKRLMLLIVFTLLCITKAIGDYIVLGNQLNNSPTLIIVLCVAILVFTILIILTSIEINLKYWNLFGFKYFENKNAGQKSVIIILMITIFFIPMAFRFRNFTVLIILGMTTFFLSIGLIYFQYKNEQLISLKKVIIKKRKNKRKI